MSLKVGKKLKILFLASLLIGLSVVFFLFVNLYSTEAEIVNYDVAGWLWNDNYGWISLNSSNEELKDYPSAAYKVVIEGDQIRGWGWSPNLGWVCFGKDCDPNYICGNLESDECRTSEALTGKFGGFTPDGGWNAKIDSVTGKISGWAKFVALKDSGVISFSSNDFAANNPGEQCFDCQKKCIAWEQIAEPGNPENKIKGKCLQYDQVLLESCKFCFTKTYFGVSGSDGRVYPSDIVQEEAIRGGSGNICFNCLNCKNDISEVDGSSRDVCSSCPGECKLFGAARDASSGALAGWAWSGDGDRGDMVNVGWIQLNTGYAGIVYPWLETQFGSVYSSESIRQRSKVSGKNATYCIFAKDVYNFTSNKCQQAVYNDVNINYLTKSEDQVAYKNALGKIDLGGLTKKVNDKYNKFGNEVVSNAATSWNSPTDLGNKVYVVNGSLSVGDKFEIKNGGSGLVIVNGNLEINGNFGYSPASGSLDLKQLGSIAWVVRGDVIVKPSVTKVAGAFIVLGNESSSLEYASNADNEYPKFVQNGHGIFFSGNSAEPLTIVGLVIARTFGWERIYSNIRQGSERVIYDGRLIANPPPGLSGFAEGLPVIRDFEF